jgi:hypothetical protein
LRTASTAVLWLDADRYERVEVMASKVSATDDARAQRNVCTGETVGITLPSMRSW